MGDPVEALGHDHADLNRRVLSLGTKIRELARDASSKPLVKVLDELREHLFLHFAREEEGVFPFVADTLPELGDHVQRMATAHDAICGGLARMFHLASSSAPVSQIILLFDRFQTTYAEHARTEAALLGSLRSRLDVAQRAQLAKLVDGL